MKQFLNLFLVLVSLNTTAQQMLVVKPNPSNAFNNTVQSVIPNQLGDSNSTSLAACYWTGGGAPGAWRSFFKMDFSSLGANTVIDSAYFSFFANVNSGYGSPGSPNFGNDNACYIARITSPWTSNTFDWNNQPVYTMQNHASLAQSTSSLQDYLHVDATNLIQDVINAGVNNGFAFLLQNESTPFDAKVFHSSASLDSTKRPYLTIYYHSIPATTFGLDKKTSYEYFPCNVGVSIRFHSPYHGKIEVLNMQGKVIKRLNVNQEKNIRVDLIENQLYIIRLVDTEGQISLFKFAY